MPLLLIVLLSDENGRKVVVSRVREIRSIAEEDRSDATQLARACADLFGQPALWPAPSRWARVLGFPGTLWPRVRDAKVQVGELGGKQGQVVVQREAAIWARYLAWAWRCVVLTKRLVAHGRRECK